MGSHLVRAFLLLVGASRTPQAATISSYFRFAWVRGGAVGAEASDEDDAEGTEASAAGVDMVVADEEAFLGA